MKRMKGPQPRQEDDLSQDLLAGDRNAGEDRLGMRGPRRFGPWYTYGWFFIRRPTRALLRRRGLARALALIAMFPWLTACAVLASWPWQPAPMPLPTATPPPPSTTTTTLPSPTPEPTPTPSPTPAPTPTPSPAPAPGWPLKVDQLRAKVHVPAAQRGGKFALIDSTALNYCKGKPWCKAENGFVRDWIPACGPESSDPAEQERIIGCGMALAEAIGLRWEGAGKAHDTNRFFWLAPPGAVVRVCAEAVECSAWVEAR